MIKIEPAGASGGAKGTAPFRLPEARKQWLSEAKGDPQEYAQRQESDFLADTNHDGEVIDFHSLRHTCGAGLAMSGVHPKVVQTVIRRCFRANLSPVNP